MLDFSLLDFKHQRNTEQSEVIQLFSKKMLWSTIKLRLVHRTKWGIRRHTFFCTFVYMLPMIEQQLEKLRDLCFEHKVEKLHVFGSAVSEEFNEHSDIDILIKFKDLSHEEYTDMYFSLHEKLEALFNRKVDLLTERSLSNPYFIANIERTKLLLYAA